jgi:hypothetical protein
MQEAMKQGFLVGLSVALVMVVAACGGDDDAEDAPAAEDPPAVVPPEERTAEGEPPTASELVGTWSIDDTEPERLVRFSPDGSFAIDDRGMLDTTPAAAGNYELDGREIIFETSGSDICVDGDSWTFEAGVPEEGRLHFVVREDAAPPCNQGVGAQWFLTKAGN